MIYHITPLKLWINAQNTGVYIDETLKTDGFIHCSTSEQIIDVANELFSGQIGLVILAIDDTKISSEIKYEDLYASGLLYPHVYGAIPVDAVEAIIDFPPNADGRFTLPTEVR